MVDLDLDLVEFNRWVDGYVNFKQRENTRAFRLETMQILAEALGHPERSCPCFHVTGSKGKGTISAFIAGILREAGYSTGVLASPHVLHFTERVGTGAGPFTQEVYDAAFLELRTAVEKLIADGALKKERVGWFELTTMFAMLCFKEAGVDYAIYEVGMGGRLDATNIVEPAACAFGPVELEHTRFLGNTLTEITLEKAGIMKPGVPCVSAPQADEVRAVLKETAKKQGAKITFAEVLGDYVKQDAAVAKMAVLKVLPEISDEVMVRGISKVSLPGRFEKITGVLDIPYILIDVAHTENSVRQVVNRMRQEKIAGKLLFGCAIEKNIAAMAKEILAAPIFSEIYLTKPGDFKKSDINKMRSAFLENNSNGVPITADPDYKKVIQKVIEKASADKEPVVVLGSFYLAGEVKKWLAENY